MPGENVQHVLAVFPTTARFDLVTEHDLLARIVHSRLEAEAATLARTGNGPTGKAPRHGDHVVLRVAAVDAERVQLHQLATVVLVDPPFRPILILLCAGRTRR